MPSRTWVPCLKWWNLISDRGMTTITFFVSRCNIALTSEISWFKNFAVTILQSWRTDIWRSKRVIALILENNLIKLFVYMLLVHFFIFFKLIYKVTSEVCNTNVAYPHKDLSNHNRVVAQQKLQLDSTVVAVQLLLFSDYCSIQANYSFSHLMVPYF